MLSLRDQHFVALDLNPDLKPLKDFRAVIDVAEFDVGPTNEGADNMSVSNVREELVECDQGMQSAENDMEEFETAGIPRSFAFDSYEQISELASPASVLYGRSSSPFFAPPPNPVLRQPQIIPVYSAEPEDDQSFELINYRSS